MGQLHFLPVRTAKSRLKTKRELELEDVEAKSYAASVSHTRAGRGRRGKIPSSSTDSSESDDRSLTTRSPPTWPTKDASPSPTTISSSPLDPFFPLPQPLSSTDRTLLHFYLTLTPRAVYGLPTTATYCPVRDAVVPELATNPLFTRWVLYLSAAMSGESRSTVLARRAAIYADMRAMLASPAELTRDATLMVLLAAGIAENRSGNVSLAGMHYAGALGLLRSHRGGLRAIQRMKFVTGMGVANGLLMQDVSLFGTRAELEGALGRMVVPRGWMVGGVLDERVQRFFGEGLQCFPAREVAFHVANLHMLLTMVEWEVPEGLMEDLVRMILGGGEKLTPSAITFMICACAVRAGEWYGKNPKLRSWETLEFVRLIMFAPKAREMMVKAMSGWLRGVEGENVGLEEAKIEILEGWELTSGIA